MKCFAVTAGLKRLVSHDFRNAEYQSVDKSVKDANITSNKRQMFFSDSVWTKNV